MIIGSQRGRISTHTSVDQSNRNNNIVIIQTCGIITIIFLLYKYIQIRIIIFIIYTKHTHVDVCVSARDIYIEGKLANEAEARVRNL